LWYFNDVGGSFSSRGSYTWGYHLTNDEDTTVAFNHEKSFKDVRLDVCHIYRDIFIVRDFWNELASLFKLHHMTTSSSKRLQYIQGFIGKYNGIFASFETDSLAHRDSTQLINYDNWLLSRAYRNDLAGKWGIHNSDNIDYVPPIGGGSSFTGTAPKGDPEEYLHRTSLLSTLDTNECACIMASLNSTALGLEQAHFFALQVDLNPCK